MYLDGMDTATAGTMAALIADAALPAFHPIRTLCAIAPSEKVYNAVLENSLFLILQKKIIF